jgi:translocation and assembly module TamB
LSGVNSSVADPLSSIRSGLGLDRLTVNGGTRNGAGPSVEGGKYVARGVYLGAKQGTGGSNGAGTQAEVQIDLWRGLKLNSTAGSGPRGNSVGLSHEFNY